MPPPHVERMQVEHDELAKRLAKLTSFMGDQSPLSMFNQLTPVDRDLLRAQQQAMIAYLGILTMRLNRADAHRAAETSDDVASIAGELINIDVEEITGAGSTTARELASKIRKLAASALGQRCE
jgi:hypothetical protein